MPSGMHLAIAGVAVPRTDTSSTLFIHAAIPLRMSSAKLRTVWRRSPRAILPQGLVACRQRMAIEVGNHGIHRAFFFERARARFRVRSCTTKPKRSATRSARRWGGPTLHRARPSARCSAPVGRKIAVGGAPQDLSLTNPAPCTPLATALVGGAGVSVSGLSHFGLVQPRAPLIAENLCLRQQLSVLQRRRPQPRLSNANRRFWICASRWFASWRSSLFIVKPETVLAMLRPRPRKINGKTIAEPVLGELHQMYRHAA
jgi:hypothetical protein